MKSFISFIILYFLLLFISSAAFSQQSRKKVVVTGVRFAYPLVEKWIAGYRVANPDVEVVIASRTETDPAQYDLLIEAYEPSKEIKESREYLSIGRYALLPIANAQSAFAKAYAQKGLTSDLIKQIYFHDIYADKEAQKQIKTPYTVYTRLQKAGAPATFAHYFGYEQQQIKGKSIAGSDEHLIKALLKDTAGIAYSHLGLIYNLDARAPLKDITILPVDRDGNGRVNQDEKDYSNLDVLLKTLEETDVKNIPIEYLHISLSKHNATAEAVKFLQWVLYNGLDDLQHFGFLKPEAKRFQQEKEKFEQLSLLK